MGSSAHLVSIGTMAAGGTGSLLRDAEEALGLVYRDPSRATELATQVLARATVPGDARAKSMAERVLGGLARVQGHDLRASVVHLRRAIRLAEDAGLPVDAAEARASLVLSLAHQGDPNGALREADLAGAVLRGVKAARLETQRAHVHLDVGNLDAALDCYQRALPVLRRGRDRLGEAHACVGRGLVRFMRGAVVAAEADMRRAEQLYVALGEPRMTASALQHVALVVALGGDVPEALRCFDRADELLGPVATTDGMALIDRSEIELTARLVGEARRAAQVAVDTLAEQGEKAYWAIALLRLAEAALVEGDTATARRSAEDARRAFTAQRRPAWAALARHVGIRAARLAGDCSSSLLAEARAAARHLAAAGFAGPSQDARLLAATVALDLGRRGVARRELALAAQARRRGPVALRVRAWHATALLRLAEGDRRGAGSALRAGVRLIDRYRAALGATELRSYASAHAAELMRLGLGMAMTDGNAPQVLEWGERWRGGSLRLTPVRPPDDARLAAALSELRAVVGELDAAALAGRTTSGLHARQAALEEAVRSHARHASGVLAALVEPPPRAEELTRAVGDRALVEIVDHDGLLHAVVVVAGRVRLHRLGSSTEVSTELEHLRFALRRLARGDASPASAAAAVAAVTYGAAQLDTMLLRPVADDIADRAVVVVPTGILHALPWSILPSCATRSVTVSPSAALWLRSAAARESAGQGGVVLVAGPGLTHASTEVAALARRYPAAVRLTGARATCAAVCAALDGADLAHIACHGRFRADNPLFSSLQLADGPLTVYDLERLGQAPRVLVLSACDSGMSDVQPGDELMGLATAVFSLGTRTLVASLYPVPDGPTRALMLALHTGLRAGLPPAVALARAQGRVAATGATGLAAAAGFVCLGAG